MTGGKELPEIDETGATEPPDIGEMLDALRAAEKALAQGQENVAGTDDTDSPGAMRNTVWFEPLRRVRAVLRAADAYMEEPQLMIASPEFADTVYPSVTAMRKLPGDTRETACSVTEAMADTMIEVAGSWGCCTFDDLRSAGYTMEEIIACERDARALAAKRMRDTAGPHFDRLDAIVVKLVAAAPHAIPTPGGFAHGDDSRTAWDRFCTARAAYKVDPWVSQGERCLSLADAFLRCLPLLPAERNRAVQALARSQKKAGR